MVVSPSQVLAGACPAAQQPIFTPQWRWTLLTVPMADWTRSMFQHLPGSSLDSTELSNSKTLPGQPLLSLIYPLCLPEVTLHAFSQDNTHDRWPSFGHYCILRIQCAHPTLAMWDNTQPVCFQLLLCWYHWGVSLLSYSWFCGWMYETAYDFKLQITTTETILLK